MKKVIILGSALACLAGIPAANAQIVIQPTIVESAPVYAVEPYAPAVVTYPVHYDHHHRYDWRYWQSHRDHNRR